MNKNFSLQFCREDSYACKNLFKSKNLDEEKKTDFGEKIKRSKVFFVDYIDANIDFSWSKMYAFLLPKADGSGENCYS